MRYAFLLCMVAWTITLSPPTDVVADHETPLRATVLDEAGKPVQGAQVEMAVTMVDMDHGETKHTAKETSAGVYEASKAKFMMSGTWNVKVKAQKGSEQASKDFKINVKQ